MPTKTCRKCGVEKPISHFSPSARNRHGVKTICHPCENTYQKWLTETNPEYRQRQLDNAARRRQEIREIVQAAKDVPCHDCGVQYPWFVMEFDHRPGEVKVGMVSQLASTRALQKVLDEMAKCDVVCANCHRLRTYGRNPERFSR